MLRKNGELPSVKEYIDHLITKGIITKSDVEDINKDTKNITVEGYVFLVEKEKSGNIKITYQRKADNKARISKIEVTKTTINSISVKVITSNVKEGSYKYSIKDLTIGEESFTLVTTLETNEYTFTGLTIDHEYIVQVEIETQKGGDTKETETIKTEPPKVTSITLDKTDIEILKGKTETITAEVLPEDAENKTLTWTSSNEEVVTVDNTGKVTGIGEGKALVTATSSNGISINCNVTVTLPPPPTAGVGAETHTAKEIPYSWEQLHDIAKVISDNYGEEAGKVNKNTAEVAVVVEGEPGTLGIGDWKTVKYGETVKKVRILGFNHDTLVDTGVYGGTNTYAGISFEFMDFITKAPMNSNNCNDGGWGSCELRNTLNNVIIDSLENKGYIKEVNKEFASDAYDENSVTASQDILWLLSTCEVYAEGKGYSVAEEGFLYKVYTKEYTSSYKHYTGNDWWARSVRHSDEDFCCFGSLEMTGGTAFPAWTAGVKPGFCI